jgi:putative salt-induced outer membrane protein YdiY
MRRLLLFLSLYGWAALGPFPLAVRAQNVVTANASASLTAHEPERAPLLAPSAVSNAPPGPDPVVDPAVAPSVELVDGPHAALDVAIDRANAEPPFLVEFTNGDRLRGEALGVRADRLLWRFDFGSEIVLPLDALARIERTDGSAVWTPEVGDVDALFGEKPAEESDAPQQLPLGVPVEDDPAAGDVSEEAAPEEAGPAFTLLDPNLVFEAPKLVLEAPKFVARRAASATERIEFGGTFIDGNSESDAMNLNGEFADTTDRRKHQVKFGGFVAGARDEITANRWFVNGTFDFNRPKTARWLLFVTSRNEYDEFENLDYRGTLSAGVGYRLVNRVDREVLFRVGPGVTGEFFRDPYRERITPDLFGQMEIEWPVFDRLIYEHDTTVNPSIEDFRIFRLVSTNGLLLPLDEDETWNLKFGVRWEYNSQPNKNRLPSDYTTNLLLVYKRKK